MNGFKLFCKQTPSQMFDRVLSAPAVCLNAVVQKYFTEPGSKQLNRE